MLAPEQQRHRDRGQCEKPPVVTEMRDDGERQLRRLLLEEPDPRARAVVDREEDLLRCEQREREIADERDEGTRQEHARLAAGRDAPNVALHHAEPRPAGHAGGDADGIGIETIATMTRTKAVFLLLGVAALGYLVARIGVTPILASLRQLRWWQFVLICLPYA